MGENGEDEAEWDTEAPGLAVTLPGQGDTRRKARCRKRTHLGLDPPNLKGGGQSQVGLDG